MVSIPAKGGKDTMNWKVGIILFIFAFGCGYVTSLMHNRFFFDGEGVSVNLPDFAGEGIVQRSAVKIIEGAPGPVLCYEIRFLSSRPAHATAETATVFIPGKFIHSNMGFFEKWHLVK